MSLTTMGAGGGARWFSGAAVAIDFANGWSLDGSAPSSLLTTTRASDAYSDDTAGRWSLFASGVPRITDKGLLVEEARTNSIRNNSMQGAVAGTPGTAPTNWIPAATGLTIQLVGTGTENGIDYIDYRFSGTTGAVFGQITLEATTAIPAVNGQTWAFSFFTKLVAGSWANVTAVSSSLNQRDAGGSSLGSVGIISPFLPSATLVRASGTATTNNASTAFVLPLIGFAWSSGVAVDFTLRIGWPQLELGSFATSPIRTTSAAATRAADAITVTSPPTFGSALSLYAQWTLPALITANSAQMAVQIDDGSNNNRISLAAYWQSIAQSRAFSASTGGGAAGGTVSMTLPVAGTRYKTALAFSLNSLRASKNGVLGSEDTTADVPVGLTSISVGCGIGGTSFQLNGYLERMALFSTTALTNAQLQALTA